MNRFAKWMTIFYNMPLHCIKLEPILAILNVLDWSVSHKIRWYESQAIVWLEFITVVIQIIIVITVIEVAVVE